MEFLATSRPDSTTSLLAQKRILDAAIRLLAAGGIEAVSTRSVAEAAGTQAPTIYRLFGDKQGLLDAVALHGFTNHLVEKASLAQTDDPVQDLREGWDQHIEFGLRNPALYVLVYGQPKPGPIDQAAAAASRVLGEYVHRVAEAGRLKVPEDVATQLISATGRGVTLALLGMSEQDRSRRLSVLAREMTIDTVTRDSPVAGGSELSEHAIGMRAVLPGADMLTERERALMTEWLDRITA